MALAKDKENWCYDPNHKNSLKIKRNTNRGQYISLMLSFSAIIQATMKAMGANEKLLLVLYGFILTAVFGYIGDKVIGTDEGFQAYNDKTGHAIAYGMGSLATSDFFRYFITVLLDMFISTPIQFAITYLAGDFIHSMKTASTGLGLFDGPLKSITKIMGANFDNILQSFVAIITFMAYFRSSGFEDEWEEISDRN